LIGYDRALCSEVLSAFTGALARSLAHRAKAQLDLPSVRDAHVGAVTFIQRSDSSLRLNVPLGLGRSPRETLHKLALDGVYVRGESGTLAFHALGAPTFEEVQQVAVWTHARIARVLRAPGRSLDGLGDEQPKLTVDRRGRIHRV